MGCILERGCTVAVRETILISQVMQCHTANAFDTNLAVLSNRVSLG